MLRCLSPPTFHADKRTLHMGTQHACTILCRLSHDLPNMIKGTVYPWEIIGHCCGEHCRNTC